MRATLLLLLVAVASPSRAQDSASTGKSDGAAPAQETKKAPKAINIKEAIEIEGRIQKPEAFYFLDRSKPTFDDLNRTESFVPKVVQSVQQDPF
jgi:hypothetical protein